MAMATRLLTCAMAMSHAAIFAVNAALVASHGSTAREP